MPLDPSSEFPRPSLARLRDDSRAIFAAGVAAVDPRVAVQRAVVRRGDTLEPSWRRVWRRFWASASAPGR